MKRNVIKKTETTKTHTHNECISTVGTHTNFRAAKPARKHTQLNWICLALSSTQLFAGWCCVCVSFSFALALALSFTRPAFVAQPQWMLLNMLQTCALRIWWLVCRFINVQQQPKRMEMKWQRFSQTDCGNGYTMRKWWINPFFSLSLLPPRLIIYILNKIQCSTTTTKMSVFSRTFQWLHHFCCCFFFVIPFVLCVSVSVKSAWAVQCSSKGILPTRIIETRKLERGINYSGQKKNTHTHQKRTSKKRNSQTNQRKKKTGDKNAGANEMQMECLLDK